MNNRNFAQALRNGLGSAIVEIKNSENKTTFRETLLKCCLKDISYDQQSEGTKGYYLYQAIIFSEEPEYYEEKVINRFLANCSDRLFDQLVELLYCLGNHGSEGAKDALRMKYDYFLKKAGRLRETPNLNEGPQWDEITFRLMELDGFFTFKQYTESIGKILLENPNNRKAYGDWFIERSRNRFGEKKIDDFLTAEYEENEAIKKLVDTLKADTDFQNIYREAHQQEKVTIHTLLEVAQTVASKEIEHYGAIMQYRPLFFKNALDTEILELANVIVAEKNETVKGLLLRLFLYKPFPLGIDALLEYALSDNRVLSENAIVLLGEYKDKRIHAIAMELLKEKGLNSMALGLLKKNYEHSDDKLITPLIKKLSTVPHHVQQDVRDIYCNNSSVNALPVLLHVYRKGKCAYCRSGIVEAMANCKVLSAEIMEECLYDSYDETREFIRAFKSKD